MDFSFKDISISTNFSVQHNTTRNRISSLTRPERSRFDENHPQYHTQRLTSDNDLRSSEDHRRSMLRKGFLEDEERVIIEPVVTEKVPQKKWNTWQLFCYLVTCCCPPPVLKIMGKKDKNAQMAYREKMGLVVIIMLIMGFVGFLTFGFTQVVCPRPPLSFRLNSINSGYVIIHGWSYMLANWNSHPQIPGISDAQTNVIYEPINAGGKDASLLFQNINQYCTNIITPKVQGAVVGQDSLPSYFPCQLVDKDLLLPDPSSYSNHTACHRSPATHNTLETMRTLGIKNSDGVYEKAGRIYYEWEDVNSTSHLAVYNGYNNRFIILFFSFIFFFSSYVLNLNLLQSLPQELFNVPSNGLIQRMIQNISTFGGQDITHTVLGHQNQDWPTEAQCLLDIIKVGEIDTKSVGCMTSDIVLYTSLIVILGVILVKFFLAVVFGWFLSWKLGNFKEGKSYKDRMQRDREIENWTTGIHVPAQALRPVSEACSKPPSFSNHYPNKKASIIPRKSRFTQPDAGSMHFNPNEKSASVIWKESLG